MAMLVTPSAGATAVSWVGTGNANWSDATQWSSNPAIPGSGDTVTFEIVQGSVSIEGLLLIFPHSPFASGATELRVGARKPATETIGAHRGAFHYKSIDDSALTRGRPIYDIWCPSIIVD